MKARPWSAYALRFLCSVLLFLSGYALLAGSTFAYRLRGDVPIQLIVVTRVAGDDPDLRAALRRLGALGHAWGRSIVPGFVLDIEPPAEERTDAPFLLARRALEKGRFATIAAARTVHVRVVTWRAGADPLESVIVRGKVIA